jgi:PAS domain-containing protein
MCFPIAISVLAGSLIGRGVVPLFVGAPMAMATLAVGFAIIGKVVQTPLKQMVEKINFLSKGDLNFTFDKKFLKGKHELAEVSRKIVQLGEAQKKTAEFADNVGSGNLNVEYTLLGENDSLGKSMLGMRSNLQKAEMEMEQRRIEDQRRNWATEGLAKFAEILRLDNDNFEILLQNVISQLVKYLDVNQGGIFVLNQDERVLEMKACYAFDRNKFIEKQIHPGEGLVGTCYLEGKPIYMTEIPDNYIAITSGLGKANPRAVLICPLKVSGETYGVVELASFSEFEPYQREFVEKISESIASTIGSVNVNIRTNNLLTQTKLQAEEMTNQEEELRQNMEEMQATQEEMRRRETELQEIVAEMGKSQLVAENNKYEIRQFHDAVIGTYNIVEFSVDAYIVDINNNVLALFGSTERSDFIGKHITTFISQEEYAAVWGSAEQGKIFETVQQVEAKGKTNNLRQRYVPIRNKNGELLRVFSMILLENS